MNLRPFLPEWFRSWWACRLLNRLHRTHSTITRATRLLEDVGSNEYTDGFRAHLQRQIDDANTERMRVTLRLNSL